MHALDWVLLVLWAGIMLSGFWKGAVRLVFGIGGLIAGIWLAVSIGADLTVRLEHSIHTLWLATLCAYLLPVLLAVLIFTLAGWGIERTLKALHLGWANRLMGAVLAGGAGALLLGIFLVLSLGLSPQWREICRESLFFPYLSRLADVFFSHA